MNNRDKNTIGKVGWNNYRSFRSKCNYTFRSVVCFNGPDNPKFIQISQLRDNIHCKEKVVSFLGIVIATSNPVSAIYELVLNILYWAICGISFQLSYTKRNNMLYVLSSTPTECLKYECCRTNRAFMRVTI